MTRIQRLFGFADYLESSNDVLGRRLILILLGDLLENNVALGSNRVNECLAMLKGTVDGKTIARALNVASLAKLVSVPRGGNTSYRRAISLVQASGRANMEEILSAGIVDLSLHLFPAVQLYDKSRNEALFWNGQTFFRLMEDGGEEEDMTRAINMTCSVIVELEKSKINSLFLGYSPS